MNSVTPRSRDLGKKRSVATARKAAPRSARIGAAAPQSPAVMRSLQGGLARDVAERRLHGGPGPAQDDIGLESEEEDQRDEGDERRLLERREIGELLVAGRGHRPPEH